jgi:NADPH:quinone reductase-like Zn-dependent oxidoreductase
MEKNASLTGVFFAMEQSRDPQRTHDLVADLIQRVANGELRTVIDRTFPLAAAAEAHQYLESGGPFGRVILIP